MSADGIFRMISSETINDRMRWNKLYTIAEISEHECYPDEKCYVRGQITWCFTHKCKIRRIVCPKCTGDYYDCDEQASLRRS